MKSLLITRLLLFSGLTVALSSAVQLFEFCSNNDDCVRTVSNSICSLMQDGCGTGQRVCQCLPGYRSDGTSQCLKEARLDQPCGDGVVCVDASATCVASRCECLSGYRRHPYDSRRCQSSLITSQYGQTCRDSVECEGTQECYDGKCDCLAGYVYSPALKTCTEIRLGDPCQTNDDCLAVFNAVCASEDSRRKVCACETGYLSTPVALFGKESRLCLSETIELRDVGQPCVDDLASDTFCKPNLVCSQCPHNSRVSVCSKPSPSTTLGPTLGTTPTTRPAETKRANQLMGEPYTTAKSTAEEYDSYEDYGDSSTVNVPTGLPIPKTTTRTVDSGSVVPVTVTAVAQSSSDKNSTTTTEVYDYPLETKDIYPPTTAPPMQPVIRAALNEICAPPSIICDALNAQCIASRCQCGDGYEQLGSNYCHQIGLGIPLGQTCTAEDHCATTGASCRNGYCSCPDGFKAGLKGDCVEVSRNGTFGSPCEHSIDCYYGLSCITYRCRCIPGMRQVHDYDCSPRVLGEACESGYDFDCKFIKNGVCRQGNCQCREGYTRRSASECVEALWQQTDGSYNEDELLRCYDDIDCLQSVLAPKQSICIDKKCQCRSFYSLDAKTNTCKYDGVYSDEGFACTYNSDCHTAGLKCIQNRCIRPSVLSSTIAIINSHTSSGFVLAIAAAVLVFHHL